MPGATGVLGKHVAVRSSEREYVARISGNRVSFQIDLAVVLGQRAPEQRAARKNFKLAPRSARCYSDSSSRFSLNEHQQAHRMVNYQPETRADQAPFQQKNLWRSP